MSIFTGLEAELGKLWSEVSGEVRSAVEAELANVKTEVAALEAKAADIEAKVRTLAAAAKKDIEEVIEAAGPGVKAGVQGLITKLIEDLEKALTS